MQEEVVGGSSTPEATQTNTPEEAPRSAEGQGSDDSQQIPYSRFKSVNDDRKAALKRIEELEQELQTRKSSEDRSSVRQKLLDPKSRPEGWDEMQYEEQMAWMIEKSLDMQQAQPAKLDPKYERQLQQMSVERMLGMPLNDEQYEAIRKVRQDAPRLSDRDELLMLASKRFPGLFGEQGHQPGYQQEPAAGRPSGPASQGPSLKEVQEAYAKATTQGERLHLGAMLIRMQREARG